MGNPKDGKVETSPDRYSRFWRVDPLQAHSLPQFFGQSAVAFDETESPIFPFPDHVVITVANAEVDAVVSSAKDDHSVFMNAPRLFFDHRDIQSLQFVEKFSHLNDRWSRVRPQ